MTGKIIQGEKITPAFSCENKNICSSLQRWRCPLLSCCVLLRESPRRDALGDEPAFESFTLPFALHPRCLELQKPTWLRQAKFINIRRQNYN